MKSLSSQRGLSLVELLVSMALGLVVVGAVIVNYKSTGSSSNRQSALAQMGEDAQLAFSLLARDLQMAGYSDPTAITVAGGPGTNATFSKKFTGRPLFACATGMVNPRVALNGAYEDAVTCNAAGPSVPTDKHALVVNYEGTTTNAVLNAAGNPTDCLGTQAITAVGGGGNYFVVSNRYYIETSATTGRPELNCAGPGAAAGQPLIENVESMQLWMGPGDAANPHRPVRYVTPDLVPAADWSAVVAVRICLLMRSAEPVLSNEDNKAYRDCSGTEVTSTDRRLRRAFFSTVALRNKTAF